MALFSVSGRFEKPRNKFVAGDFRYITAGALAIVALLVLGIVQTAMRIGRGSPPTVEHVLVVLDNSNSWVSRNIVAELRPHYSRPRGGNLADFRAAILNNGGDGGVVIDAATEDGDECSVRIRVFLTRDQLEFSETELNVRSACRFIARQSAAKISKMVPLAMKIELRRPSSRG